MKYRKTQTIDAEQFDGSDEMVRKYDIEDVKKIGFIDAQRFVIHTLEGPLPIDINDWIATGIDGEHWPIADDIFKRTYEPVRKQQLKVNNQAIEKLKKEHEEMHDRFMKLAEFIISPEYRKLVKRQQQLISKQRSAMQEYSEILYERIIDLEEAYGKKN